MAALLAVVLTCGKLWRRQVRCCFALVEFDVWLLLGQLEPPPSNTGCMSCEKKPEYDRQGGVSRRDE